MNEDLSDVGLNALEAMEEQDTTSADGESEGVDEPAEENGAVDEPATETEGEHGGSGEEPSAGEDNNSGGGEESGGEGLSDEEFEEMAKKRGYTKTPEVDEKAEAERAEVEKLTERPEEIPEGVWEGLPKENKLIYNSLPYLSAEGKNGTIKVKTPDQIPDDFEFKNARAEMKFQNDLQAQETRATQMANAIANRTRRQNEETARHDEAVRIITEVESLQKDGLLPTPKAKNGTAEFDNDPAVVLINKVLGYRANRRREGVDLSVRDSMLIYKAEHPEEFAPKMAKEDIERRNVAKKVAGNNKATTSAVNGNDNKPQYYKVGMSTEDVLDRILDDMD